METLIKSSDELHTNAVENQNKQHSSELYHATKIEGTPFRVIETDTETFLTLGNYKIQRPNYDYDDYKNMVIQKEWDLILDVIGIAHSIHNK